MDVTTRDFGVIQMDESSVYSFPQGIYGFEDVNSYAVFMHEENGVSFVYLQAVKTTQPCFLVFSPWDLAAFYEPKLSPDDLRLFNVESEQDLIFLTIATVPSDNARQLSINIKCPIVLNPTDMTGRQVILMNEDYPVKYRPFYDGDISNSSGDDVSPSGSEV